MKNFFPLILSLLSIVLSHAQVGINTEHAQGIFHIDPKGDTQADGTKTEDDVLVTTDGRLSIGAGINPTARVHIKTDASTQGFRLEDGNQNKGYALTTDNTGNAMWKTIAKPIGMIRWKMTHPNFSFNGSAQYFTANTLANVEFETMNISGVSNTINSVTLPAGRYFVFFRGDIDGEEYLTMNIEANNTDKYAPGFDEHYTVTHLDIMELSSTATCKLYFQALTNASYHMRSALIPPFTAPAWYEIIFINLN
ncbi:hypothetical protein CLV62_11244 [Dysgonomonas alginatilytica]|uniref:Uncharacterized protein n=1 Tax=Dysgonomonas alginatilytica TaxID=1605892 RepID=A0A2V3PNB2_9BACT|nr:hypothetical protein [Dysgonomonas alginatilytica]PXV63795.1 hypothetical protein CLV62_11244 [Dysgonomonas alginatilytica]